MSSAPGSGCRAVRAADGDRRTPVPAPGRRGGRQTGPRRAGQGHHRRRPDGDALDRAVALAPSRLPEVLLEELRGRRRPAGHRHRPRGRRRGRAPPGRGRRRRRRHTIARADRDAEPAARPRPPAASRASRSTTPRSRSSRRPATGWTTSCPRRAAAGAPHRQPAHRRHDPRRHRPAAPGPRRVRGAGQPRPRHPGGRAGLHGPRVEVPSTSSSRPTSAPGWPTTSRSRPRTASSTCCSPRPAAAAEPIRCARPGPRPAGR